MAGLLTGLLGALGGPQNVLKSVGGFVGDILGGVKEGKPLGKTVLSAAEKGIKSLVAPVLGSVTGLADSRPIIVPKNMLRESKARQPRMAQSTMDRMPFASNIQNLGSMAGRIGFNDSGSGLRPQNQLGRIQMPFQRHPFREPMFQDRRMQEMEKFRRQQSPESVIPIRPVRERAQRQIKKRKKGAKKRKKRKARNGFKSEL